MIFEWDDKKSRVNRAKHDVAFEEAATAFSDPRGLEGWDLAHSRRELRFIRVAESARERVLTIVYTIRLGKYGPQKIRIISARRASRKERQFYKEAQG